MSEKNRALIRRVVDEVWTGRNAKLIDELFAPDFVLHLEPAGTWSGPAGVKQWLTHLHEMLSDAEEHIEEMVAEGDRVAIRTKLSGVVTHPESGTRTPVSTVGIVMYRVAEGRVAEQWEVANVAGILAQLGGAEPEIAPPGARPEASR